MNAAKELGKFVNDPKYREKVIAKGKKEIVADHQRKIKQLQSEGQKLSKQRLKEIDRLSGLRWKSFANGNFMVNLTEGKIKINGADYIFSDIKGAQQNIVTSERYVTKDNTVSKKHVSVGGAILGDIVAGPLGAAVGGSALGKTTHSGNVTTQNTPTCSHLGVNVNINGFITEIVILNSQVDQSSMRFSKAVNEAQTIVNALIKLSNTPVPTSFVAVEDEPTVKQIESEMMKKRDELQYATVAIPEYHIPDIYRTPEQRYMSDEEYLNYLYGQDNKRREEAAAEMDRQMAEKQRQKEEQQQRKEAEKQERQKKKAAEVQKPVKTPQQYAYEQQFADNTTAQQGMQTQSYVSETGRSDRKGKAGHVIYSIVFWIFSVLHIIYALAAFGSKGIVSGIIFLISGLLINPKLDDVIGAKLKKIPVVAIVIVLIVGFIAGMMTFPAGN